MLTIDPPLSIPDGLVFIHHATLSERRSQKLISLPREGVEMLVAEETKGKVLVEALWGRN